MNTAWRLQLKMEQIANEAADRTDHDRLELGLSDAACARIESGESTVQQELGLVIPPPPDESPPPSPPPSPPTSPPPSPPPPSSPPSPPSLPPSSDTEDDTFSEPETGADGHRLGPRDITAFSWRVLHPEDADTIVDWRNESSSRSGSEAELSKLSDHVEDMHWEFEPGMLDADGVEPDEYDTGTESAGEGQGPPPAADGGFEGLPIAPVADGGLQPVPTACCGTIGGLLENCPVCELADGLHAGGGAVPTAHALGGGAGGAGGALEAGGAPEGAHSRPSPSLPPSPPPPAERLQPSQTISQTTSQTSAAAPSVMRAATPLGVELGAGRRLSGGVPDPVLANVAEHITAEELGNFQHDPALARNYVRHEKIPYVEPCYNVRTLRLFKRSFRPHSKGNDV